MKCLGYKLLFCDEIIASVISNSLMEQSIGLRMQYCSTVLREVSPNDNHSWLTEFYSVSVILQFWKTEGRDLEILKTEIACYRKYSHLTDTVYLINYTGVRTIYAA